MEVMPSTLLRAGLLFAGAAVLGAFSTLNQDQLKMLQDPGGWDYLKMTDTGMQTDHSCFDGKLHPETCSGRLTFADDNKFTQVVKIEGQEVPRHGTYTLEDDQLALFDELGTRDGPYTAKRSVRKRNKGRKNENENGCARGHPGWDTCELFSKLKLSFVRGHLWPRNPCLPL
jgi:hypothetical protein